MLNACFGMAPLNQTISIQSLVSSRGLRNSQVVADLKTEEEESPTIHSYLSIASFIKGREIVVR